MFYLEMYKNVAFWKRPYHIFKAYLAKFRFSGFRDVEVVAITGSVGKTTAKEATISVLNEKFATIGSKENLDPIFNIPQTLLRVSSQIKKVVLEFGIEYPNEMDFYLDLVKPNIGCVTKIYWTHTEFLKNIDGVIFEKGKMLESISENGYAVLNYDDENIRNKMAKKTKAKIFWFGQNNKADLVISDYKIGQGQQSNFKISYKNEQVHINWKLIGEHQTVAAGVAASVGIISGLNLTQIRSGLEKLPYQPHRMNLITFGKFSILDDTYNSNPIAVIEALKTLESYEARSKIIVLSDMKELGDYSEKGHRQIAKNIITVNPRKVFLIGKEVRYTFDELKKLNFNGSKVYHATIKKTLSNLQNETEKSTILIKGSRHTHLEQLVFALQNKTFSLDCPVCGKVGL